MIEPLLLTTARVSTFDGQRPLTGASGFFFEREGRLFLVTSRHVVIDPPSQHFPDRIEIELHTEAKNLMAGAAITAWLVFNHIAQVFYLDYCAAAGHWPSQDWFGGCSPVNLEKPLDL